MSRLAHRLRAPTDLCMLLTGIQGNFQPPHWLLAQADGGALGSARDMRAQRGTTPSPAFLPSSASTLLPGKQDLISSDSIQWPDSGASV